MTTNQDTAVAATIAHQMGGVARLKIMLGAKVFYHDNAITVKWPNKERSRGNKCVVTLMPSDTYQVKFYNSTTRADKLVKTYDNVYCDQLIEIFEKQTGWYLKF